MLNILMIEDTKAHAYLYQKWLECAGEDYIKVWFELRPPADEVVAQFDAVICDFWMGGVNGASLCRHYRDKYPDLPLAILTNAEPELVDLDCYDRIHLLSKNTDLDSLSSDVRRWLADWKLLPKSARFKGEL